MLARLFLGILLIVLLSLLIFFLLLTPAAGELGLMALFLGVTALASGLAGYLAYRLGWWSRSPALRWTLLGGYALAGLLTFFNVWFSARLMFASQHDLLLATVLLIFAGLMAMALGYFISNAVTDRVGLLMDAADDLARGDLSRRAPVSGRDEIAALATSFNTMAARLQAADQQRLDLIAWVSHDLQTPLASVRLILQALQDGMVRDPEQVSRYLATAQRDVQSLSGLIDDLFQMAQLDAGGLQLQRSTSSLADLLSDTLESFSELARAQGVRLEGSAGPGLDSVEFDYRLTGRLLNNLLSNALRHTSAGGLVTITARRTPEGVEVSVSDSGEGIPEEDQQRIFERFQRLKDTGGAGLGLAIARSIARAHGGDLTLSSVPGIGSVFTFHLPV
jgi:signal transduction histidine kinase